MKDVRQSELGDLQRAARTLLNHGVVTEKRVGERAWRNLRRYVDPLQEAFSHLAGYTVVVSRTTVTLIRRMDRFSSSPVFWTPSQRAFDRVRYALVALVLAALERLGKQTTLTDLALRVRTTAETIPSLPFDPDQHRSRLALGHAVRVLEELGAVHLADGSREAWERIDGAGDALYDIDRSACRRLFPIAVWRADAQLRFLHEDPIDLGREPTRRARRQRMVRRLLEQSVVYFHDLNEDERTYLQREARRLAVELEQLTGAQLERRREGVALVDSGRKFSDQPFPVGGSANQVALLLGARLCELAATLPMLDAPHADEPSDQLAGQITTALGGHYQRPIRLQHQQPFARTQLLNTLATALSTELGPGLTKQHAAHPGQLLTDALRILTGHDLVRMVSGGIVIMPALARFREVRIQAEAELLGQLNLEFS